MSFVFWFVVIGRSQQSRQSVCIAGDTFGLAHNLIFLETAQVACRRRILCFRDNIKHLRLGHHGKAIVRNWDEAFLTHVKIERFKKQAFLTATAISVISLRGFALNKIETIGQVMRKKRQPFVNRHRSNLVPEIFIIQALQFLTFGIAPVNLKAVGCLLQFSTAESIVGD